jgi:hypothetical protein
MFWLYINTIILFFQDADINRFQTRNLAHTPDPRSIGKCEKVTKMNKYGVKMIDDVES